ncbi:type II toxin-antitoxin system VapC family toxin [Agaribacter flavus]|uniref:Type II toxin-antitoxin system VapC family toxin n=1 Tax=Agaribacter flavus TaxID=1902781 RepID=A0ABV7FR38_9ALTE
MIVLDTHILIWWVNGDNKLSDTAQIRIAQAMQSNENIYVSSMSAWEVSMLVNKERLRLTMDVDTWLQTVSEIHNVSFVPVDNKVAVESTRLPGEFHKDPADRMIVALARSLSAPLITADDKILTYQHVRTVS